MSASRRRPAEEEAGDELLEVMPLGGGQVRPSLCERAIVAIVSLG